MDKKSRTAYSIQNIFTNFIGYGLNMILSFVCRMIFVRCLAQEYLGVNGLFSNILSMLSLTELGISTAIGYALYKPIAEDNKEKIASLMRFYGKAYAIIGCAVAVFGLCLLPFLNAIIGEAPAIAENIHIIYLMYLLNTSISYFFSYRGTIIIASQRNYVVTSIGYVMVVIQNVVQIVLLLTTHNFMLYLIVQLSCGLITQIWISAKAKRDYPYITGKNIKPLPKDEKWGLIKNIKALTVYKLSGILVNNTDNLVITYFNGLITTGAASNYTLLTGMLNSLLGLVFNNLSASVGNLNATESDTAKYKFFKVLNLCNFWLFGWAAVGIVVISGDLVRLFFGEDYILSQSIPIILAVNFYMVGMQNAVLTYKSTMGLFKYGQYLLLITAAINIIGDIVLGKMFGLVGIFAATAVARLFTNTWYEPYAIFKYGLKLNPAKYYGKYLIYLISITAVAGVCYRICSYIQIALPLKIVVEVVVCSVITNAAFLVLFYKTEELQYLKYKIGKIIKR